MVVGRIDRRPSDNLRKYLNQKRSAVGTAVALVARQEATTMKPTSILFLGFAGVANAGEGAARRGQVNVQASATKAVVAGPALVKVYSGFSGAKVFVADA